MSQEDTAGETQALGAFLRDHREKMDASLEDVAEVTKISLPILRAIEEDNYERMPAEAFCRGFYSMYADFLNLDPKKILTRYQESRGQPSQRSQRQARPPIKKSRHFSAYAEPAAVSPAVSQAMTLLLICFTVIIGVCWYFNWNPITYLSNQLSTVPNVEEPALHEIQSSAVSSPELIKDDPSLKTEQNTLSSDSDGATVKQGMAESPTEKAAPPYHLEIDFTSDGTLNVTIDDGLLIEKNFTSGKTLYWDAQKTILLDMPEDIGATLRLNGRERPLPEAENGRRLFSFSEDSL
ncbi:MAG: helix-turn-helix domain-containing protein [Desulfocapsa sp.]|nr:helix-turn-helix domain-containing protein [Desulfocapsa sp.]